MTTPNVELTLTSPPDEDDVVVELSYGGVEFGFVRPRPDGHEVAFFGDGRGAVPVEVAIAGIRRAVARVDSPSDS